MPVVVIRLKDLQLEIFLRLQLFLYFVQRLKQVLFFYEVWEINGLQPDSEEMR